jgi:hypothetical protein
MQVLFGLFILAVLIIGLYNRRKEKKQWLKEERYDESGAWIDKRTGERGAYGSLDEEMEQARKSVAREGRTGELAQLLRDFAFNQYPGFHDLSDAQIKSFNAHVRRVSYDAISRMEDLQKGKPNLPASESSSNDALTNALKKQILDFSYQHYPALLNLELEQIRLFDQLCAGWADKLLGKIGELKKEGV